jgi:Predicted transcriptional regulators
LLTILQPLHDRLNRIPKPSELPEDSKYSPHDFYTEFGSWDEALEAAGIDEKQALLDELNRVGGKLGHVSKNSEISAHGKYSYSTYSSYFGSWDEALQQSGFEGRSRTRCESSERTREEMLSTLQSLHERLDRVPKTTDLHDMSGVSQHNYTQTFGSWDKALEAAGIDKEQAILDEIKRVAKKLGHIPTTTDIHKHDAYPASRYSSYFDSWDEALRKSGVKEMFETKSAGDESEDSAKTPDEESQSSIHEDIDSADFADLSGFKRDILYIIGGLKEPKGLEIKKELEKYYDEEINHGRLYPNLDSIEDAGLINKFEIDARSNGYKLTTVGAAHLRARLKWKAPAINGSVTGTDRAEMLEDLETSAQRDNDHKQSQSTTTAESETSPEKKNNDSIEILDKIANEFEEL